MTHDYPDLVSGAKGLLCEVIQVASNADSEFAVVGGWSPFFLNGDGEISHPGTLDVDILFRDGATRGALEEIVNALRSEGYLVSAKHDFQLLRILHVDEEEFVFNVDLLHPTLDRNRPDLFVDHVSLPIRVSDFSDDQVTRRSIMLPFSEFLFDGYIVDHDVTGTLPDSTDFNQPVPLMNEVGTLVTKAESMKSSKRRRDAFDVMLALFQARDRAELIEGLRGLMEPNIRKKDGREEDIHARPRDELIKIHCLFEEPEFRENICDYWSEAEDDTVWREVRDKCLEVLADAGIEHTADD